jgi:hypothetical protein
VSLKKVHILFLRLGGGRVVFYGGAFEGEEED